MLNMNKIFYFDTETTGLDPKRHDIIQLAYIVEINGEVKEEGEFKLQPIVHWVVIITANRVSMSGTKRRINRTINDGEPILSYIIVN